MLLEVSYVPASTCFVNLPPHTVSQILELSENFYSSLTLELSWLDESGHSHRVFVGWAGGASSSSAAVEISSPFAVSLGLPNHQKVSVRGARDIPAATRVHVEPLSTDDWEIVELHQEYLEEQILNQICVVFEGQIFPLLIRQQTLVHLKVVSTAPGRVVRLVKDAELVIAPKPRYMRPGSQNDDRRRKTVFGPSEPAGANLQEQHILRLQDAPWTGGLSLEPTVCLIDNETRKQLGWDEHQVIALTPLHLSAIPQSSQGASAAQNGRPTKPSDDADSSKPELPMAFARVQSSLVAQRGHLVVPAAILEHLRSAPYSRVRAAKVAQPSSAPVRSITLHPVHWSHADARMSRVLAGIPPSMELVSAFKEWLRSALQLQPPPVATNGTLIPLRIGGDTIDTVVHFNATSAPAPSSSSSKLPVTSSSPVVTDNSADQSTLYILTSTTLSADISVASTVSRSSVAALLDKPFDQLGGVAEEAADATAHLRLVLSSSGPSQNASALPLGPLILLSGAHGTGKSAFSAALGRYARRLLNCYVTRISCIELSQNSRVETVKGRLADTLEIATENEPSLVVLDDLESIAPLEQDDSGHSMRGAQVAEFLRDRLALLHEATETTHHPRVLVVGTCKDVAALHPSLRSVTILSKNLRLLPPNVSSRLDILQKLLKAHDLLCTDDLSEISLTCDGYVPADLEQLVERAIHNAATRVLRNPLVPVSQLSLQLSLADFKDAQKGFTPLSLKGIALHKSEVSWRDIGGLESVKSVLKETLEWPTKYGALFKQAPIRLRSGLLLYGPPGCGKTLLASAVARETGLNFISIKGPELLNKYIGASEMAVRDLFTRAYAARPCVLFFDEFDSIAPRRGHDSTGVTDRVVNQFLTQLDGVESFQGIYVLAATSRPDLIDPALLRPGRLDKCLFCPMPDRAERAKILRALAPNLSVDEEVDFEEVASWCDYYTGADLQALLYNAQLESIHAIVEGTGNSSRATRTDAATVTFLLASPLSDAQTATTSQQQQQLRRRVELIQRSVVANSAASDSQQNGHSNRETPAVRIQTRHVRKAFENMGPSVSAAERVRYDRIYADFVQSRGGDFAASMYAQEKKQTLA